jgi:hypothetical protein
MPQHRLGGGRFDGFRERGRRFEDRDLGNRRRSRQRKENGTDPSGSKGRTAFLALSTQWASTTITDAGRIQHPIGAIALRSAFLGKETVIGGTKESAIGLRCKS